MTEGSLNHLPLRLSQSTVRPGKKQILRAHMTALARRLYGPEAPGNHYRGLAVSILQARRRAAGR
jgi:hypothetical protein